jgi:4,5-DOPA dioxygenase extradiol
VADVVHPTWVGLDRDSWGLDHGTWSVLVHAFPGADIPVVQLAINATKPFDDHLALGTALAPLRDRGVLIVGSGNAVHNLRRIDWSQPDTGYDWARRFDDDVASIVTSDPGALPGVVDRADLAVAHPTPDHFIPLLYVAGLAAAARDTLHTLVHGYAMGSLSMVSYGLGCTTVEPDATAGAPELPHVPADETNL